MPLIASTYKAPFLFRNAHISTIYPSLFRKVKGVIQTRERLTLADGDFIDLDLSYASNPSNKVAVILHGLEGNGQRQYTLGLSKHLNNKGWDTAIINLRGCSGEINKKYKSYHAGASDDLNEVINYMITNHKYTNISLCGFSLGGNIVLKYLGEGRATPSIIKSAVAISVPCDLLDSLTEISKPKNFLYQRRFLKYLKQKLVERQIIHPDKIALSNIIECKNLIDIDNLYTSKAHGYKDASDYYAKCSSKQFLTSIKIPTLILNAKNDSFLGPKCYPIQEAKNNDYLSLEISKHGGHVGFYTINDVYYNESKTVAFLDKNS